MSEFSDESNFAADHDIDPDPIQGPVHDSGHDPIHDEIPCVYCGYLLRGLDPAGTCPECGGPIENSLRGDLLCYSHPAWLAKLRRGTTLMLWYAALTIGLGVMLSCGGGILRGMAGAGGTGGAGGAGGANPPVSPFGLSNPTQHLMIIRTVSIGVGSVLGLLYLASVFLVTTPEPRSAETEDPVVLRTLIRICAITGYVAGLLNAAAQLTASQASQSPTALEVLTALLSLISVVAVVGLFILYRRLALRIPDYNLARNTRTLMWCNIALGVLGGVAIIASGILAGSGGIGAGGFGAVMLGAIVLSCGLLIAAILVVIWGFYLLTQYRNAFITAEEIAKDIEPEDAPFAAG